MTKFIITFFGVIICNLLFAQQFKPAIISSGGGLMSNSNAIITFTIGEPVSGNITNSSSKLTQGFQQTWIMLPAAAGTITGATSICKGTNNVTFSVPTIANATSYIWTLPTGATGTSTTNSISVNFSSSAISGNIKVKGHNTNGDGAESSLAITLNDIPVTPTISLSGGILQSNAGAGNQWYFNSGIINNATASTYTPTQTGNYYVIVTLNTCTSSPSNTIAFTVTGINDIAISEKINVYPNPTTDKINIKFEKSISEKTMIELFDINGKILLRQNIINNAIANEINISNFPENIYFVKISTQSGKLLGTYKIQKIK